MKYVVGFRVKTPFRYEWADGVAKDFKKGFVISFIEDIGMLYPCMDSSHLIISTDYFKLEDYLEVIVGRKTERIKEIPITASVYIPKNEVVTCSVKGQVYEYGEGTVLLYIKRRFLDGYFITMWGYKVQVSKLFKKSVEIKLKAIEKGDIL